MDFPACYGMFMLPVNREHPPSNAHMAAAGGGCFSICCDPHHPHHALIQCHHHDRGGGGGRHLYLSSIDSLHPPKASMHFATIPLSHHNFVRSSSPFPTAAVLLPPHLSSTRAFNLDSQRSTSTAEEQHETLDEAAKEELWQQLFLDPSLWWDRRSNKENPQGPDFEHKRLKMALWVNDKCNPSWVEGKLATLTQQPPQKSEFYLSSPSLSSSSAAYFSSSADQASRKKHLREDFLDPSQYRDRGSDVKKSPRSPDFEHKSARKSLCIDDSFNLPWVHTKLSAIQIQEQEKSKYAVPAISGKVAKLELLWQEYFADPTRWWDNRFIRKSKNYPDFKHKSTLEGLWIEDPRNPPWLKAKLTDRVLSGIQFSGECQAWVRTSIDVGSDVNKLCQEGRLKEALHLVELMVEQNTPAPINAYAILFKMCGRRKALMEGKRLHILIVQSGLESDTFIGNTIVDMYAKCGSVLDARKVFDRMCERNVFSWTAIISAYAGQGHVEEAMHLFHQMEVTGIAPDKVVLLVVLKMCAKTAALEQGKRLHSQIIKRGLESDVLVGSSLVDMYAKCKRIEDARHVFNNLSTRDVVSWTAMIGGYAQQGLGKEALLLYEQMKEEGLKPDNVTYILLLKSCASIADLKQGIKLHSEIVKIGLDSDMIVGSVLIEMYANCGCIKDARQVFDKISERDTVLWNVMIGAYAREGLCHDALALYEQMKEGDLQPNNVTYVLLLNACASIAALERGKLLHLHIMKKRLDLDVLLGSALVDMYAKSGSIGHARRVFDHMRERNVVSWNAMLAGYAQEGLGKDAVTLFEQMRAEGVMPNEITYITLLSACSHSGLIDEGRQLFELMCQDHSVTPSVDHYACMVDLLGRAGCLEEAEDLINNLPIQADVVIWRTLLGAARNHGHVEIGRRAFDHVLKLEPQNASAYVLLSNTYAAASRKDELANIKEEM